MIFLASTELGLLQTILDGGLPLALLVALVVVARLYHQEKTDHALSVKACSDTVTELQKEFTTKVEILFRERLEFETENARVILRATEVMESVVNTLQKTNHTLEDLIDD